MNSAATKSVKRWAVVMADLDSVMGFKTERAARKFVADRQARGWWSAAQVSAMRVLPYYEAA